MSLPQQCSIWELNIHYIMELLLPVPQYIKITLGIYLAEFRLNLLRRLTFFICTL